MKLHVPSFRVQVLALITMILASSVLFYRFFFLASFEEYEYTINQMEIGNDITTVYQDYHNYLDADAQVQFRIDMERIVANDMQRQLASELFKDDIDLYSMFIFTFLLIVMLGISYMLLNLISRSLRRLQAATSELMQGNWEVRVAESRFLPLNSLIISFNRMAEELQSSQKQLIRAEKEVVWREMARVMAHEIKNPLTPILLTVERLEYKLLTNRDSVLNLLPNSISIIKEEIANLKKLTINFSQFAKLPDLEFSDFDLNKLLRDLITPYEDRAEITLDLDESIPRIHGDKFQFRLVIVNLVQNAIQACDDHSVIHISSQHQPDQVVIQVKDNGKGIPGDDIQKIFEPYFSRKKKGTGLGLAIVRKIVEQHSGTISVESEVGEGTTFTITLRTQSQPDSTIAEGN